MSNGPNHATILRNLYTDDCIYLMHAAHALEAIGHILGDKELENMLERNDVVGLTCATQFIGYQLGIGAESMQKQIYIVQKALEEKEVRDEN